MPPLDKPLIVAARDGARRLVVAADQAAQSLGVRAGCTVALAQAMTPGLTVVVADPEGDAAALDRLAAWALRYAPIVAADPPDGFVIDITGAAHLFGGEAELVADLTDRLAKAGVDARAAVADTSSAAWGLARFAAPSTIALAGDAAAAMAALPIAALRLDPAIVAALRRVGFDTVRELADAPRPSLAVRFGAMPTRRLDQAFGRLPEPIDPITPPTTPHARLAFPDPLMHGGGLAIALEKLAERLCAALETAGLGARRLDLRFHRVDGHVAALRVGASRSTRDAAHIVRLFGERLDRIDPGFGIEAAVLAASWTEPLEARQIGAHASDEAAERGLAVLVDRLVNRIGEHGVYRLTPVESDIPERSLRPVPAMSPPLGRSWNDGPRPSRMLNPPEPVEATALLPDHPPAVFTWRGRRRRVRRADGPERVHGEWWRADREVWLARDYFRVEDEDGQRYWLFRVTDAEQVRWFIQGVFA